MFLVRVFKFISARQKRIFEERKYYKSDDGPLNEERFRERRTGGRSHAASS